MKILIKILCLEISLLLFAALISSCPVFAGDITVTLFRTEVQDDIRTVGFSEILKEGKPSPSVSFTLNDAFFSIVERDGKLTYAKSILAENERAITSYNGDFIVIQRYGPGARIEHVTVKDKKGSIIWEKDTPGYHGIVGISNNGGLLVALSVKGPPEGTEKKVKYIFHDEAGEVRGEVDIENPRISELSSDSRRFVVCTYQNDISVYDQNAKLLWSMKEPCKNLAISENAELLALYGDKSISFYEKDHLLTTIKTEKPLRNIGVSSDGSFAIVTTYHQLYCYRVRETKLLWEYQLPSDQLYFNSVSISRNGDYLVCGVQKDKGESFDIEHRYLEGSVYLFDKNGKILWQDEYEYSKSNAWTPIVKISENANFFTVITRDGLDLYQIEK